MTSQPRTAPVNTGADASYPDDGYGPGATRVRERHDLDGGYYGDEPDYGDVRGRRRGAHAVDTDAQAHTPTIADPAPLGLGAFALTTFVLSVFNAKLITDVTLEAVVLPIALFYGGLAQMLAGMWEFKKGNTFGATAFTSFGAFWLAYAAYAKFVLPNIENQPDAYKATGLFLLAWTIFAALMFTAAIRISGALGLVFLAATTAFALLTIGTLGQDASLTKLGGIGGFVAAGAAWYTCWAGLLNDAWKRTVLPIFPVKARG